MNADENGRDVGRDDELGRAMAVPPLDEVTRRRMVRVAMARSDSTSGAAGTGRSRFLAIAGVAAALLAGVVVGGIVVTRPEAPVTPTAAGSDQELASDKQAATQPAAAAAPVPPQPLGDLGAAADIQELARAVDVRLQAGRSGAAEDSAAALAPCADALSGELVLVSAAGTATLDGKAVVVRIGPSPSGENLVVVLDVADCSVVAITPLPLA